MEACSKCGHEAISFHWFRNRPCPKGPAKARDRWLPAQEKDPLPTSYVPVVFTWPRQLAPVALQNQHAIYTLLFRTSAETRLEVARDPKQLGAEIGFFRVLPSRNQKLQQPPHVAGGVPAGDLAPDHSRWIDSPRKFFRPVDVLQEVFRGKFVDGLTPKSFICWSVSDTALGLLAEKPLNRCVIAAREFAVLVAQ